MTKTCPVCMYEMESTQASCPQCGFRFLGETQEFKPIVIDPINDLDGKIEPKAVLRVVRGPQVGTIYKLDKDTITLGRNPQCDIFLNDMTVSRMHAQIDLIDGCFILKDVDSFNGVWVNNASIDSRALKSGDFIQIGKFAFVYDEEI